MHGMHNTRLYNIWKGMRQRCLSLNSSRYKYYGARGIAICPEWSKFEVFMEWAFSHGYSDDLSIDRINNDGNYSPENCRWSTVQRQALNRRPRQSKLGITNITVRNGKYRVQIRRNNKIESIGTFALLSDAIKERDKWCRRWEIEHSC